MATESKLKGLKFEDLMLEGVLIVIFIALAVTAPGFFTTANLLNVLRNVSMQGIIAFGMTMVIIAGEIDLSVGSAVAFGGCMTAYIAGKLSDGTAGVFAIVVAMAITLALGFGVGIFTGFIRNHYQVPTFIITLALMTVLSGVANLLTGGFPLTPFPDWYNFLGGGYLFGIPFPAILFLLAFAAMYFLTNFTSFGRAIYAIGGNMEAARLSGIKVNFIKTMVLAITAMLSQLSGILTSAQIMSGTPTTAKGWELDVISAVIIGGTSLMGGAGRIWGTFIGVIFLGVIINGMTLLNISEYWQYVVRGGLILGAVLLNQIQAKKQRG